MKKNRISILCGIIALCLLINPLMVFADASVRNENCQSEYIDVTNIDLSTFENIEAVSTAEINIQAESSLQIVDDAQSLEIRRRIYSRSADLLPDNPRVNETGTLTSEDDMDIYFFSVTEDRFMVAALDSENTNYAAQLAVVDYEQDDISLTNIGDTAGNLIALNGLPMGDYAFIIYSSDESVDDDYTFMINAANPSGQVSGILTLTNDLLHFVIRYSSGDVYGDGTFVYNVNNMSSANTHLSWNREEDVNWSGGYLHRTHNVYNVRIRSVSGPASWHSSAGSSDNVMLIFCDVGTGFTFFQSAYQSGSYHEYSFEDTFGRVTPRALDQYDLEEFSHILAYDLNTGTVIDFYSPLNIYYASGAQSAPTVNFY